MVGMMTPSAAPMILIYARVGRQASAQGKPFAATGWFATGYLLAWFGFSLVATAAQWVLERAALLDSMMAGTNQVFGGIVLIAAGVYQWSPLKDTMSGAMPVAAPVHSSARWVPSRSVGCIGARPAPWRAARAQAP
jgi:predicted metal-binding membrane protein